MLLENYLKNRNQRVVLNGINSSWKNTQAGVPQESVLGPLLFLICINDLPHEISSICKMFADDTSLFSKVKDSSLSLSDLNHDLEIINQWVHLWAHHNAFTPESISCKPANSPRPTGRSLRFTSFLPISPSGHIIFPFLTSFQTLSVKTSCLKCFKKLLYVLRFWTAYSRTSFFKVTLI